MPTFSAAASVEALDYDFTAVPDYPKALKAKGTVKEPSDAKIGAFLDGLKKMATTAKQEGLDLGVEEDASVEDILTALDTVTGEAFVKLMAKTAELYAALCGDSPSFDQLQALPLRVRTEFYAWVMAEVVRPEGGKNAGNGQVVKLHTAATG